MPFTAPQKKKSALLSRDNWIICCKFNTKSVKCVKISAVCNVDMKKITGYVRTKKLREMGFSSRQVRSLAEQGHIIRLKQGLYRNANMCLQDQGFVDVCYAMSYAVISGFSALSYYGLTTHIPTEITVSVPREKIAARLIYPPVSVIRQDMSRYSKNISRERRGRYVFRIFDIEKTVCDAVKYRKKIGMDIVKEALREYLKMRDKNLPKLYETAKKCRVFDVLNEMLTLMM